MKTGYAKQQTMALEHASPEQTLAWGLTTTARKMAAVMAPGTPRETVLDAVRLNWRLWTIIQAEQADPDCQTPRSIREGLLNLSNFVDKRSVDLLAVPTAEKLEVLININRNIAAGLLGTDLSPEQKAERDRQATTSGDVSA
ncbi:MAG TPA: flagellar biosynthesis regulator FlaF [Aliidongia sp.]|uniref:flagellar biosynthesis regulator FlaF n=1 Tax=Aliidongia sp. TaxID=1914230 RepID=UPI002DDCFED5|nr:flagellar biosynthesis regulator FlaF [Aliidongia sp.]HEV2678815.1 flagellar biosynthesis regulator FlaF [Aliidongia sp.]